MESTKCNRTLRGSVLMSLVAMSPDFLYNISEPVDETPLLKVAEDHVTYG